MSVFSRFIVLAVLAACSAGTALAVDITNEEPPIPEWRGTAPGTQWLGADMLWRCREGLVFHLLDDAGTGFNLDVAVRDMNVYQNGPRPTMLWITGPSGNTLVKEIVPDDGITTGELKYKDGIADLWQDVRYHEWHRVHSPGGVPPNKERSPYLRHPETIPPRVVKLRVPPAGKGLYRLTVVASWDHWLSVTPNRPVKMAIHPGPGPLAIPMDRLAEAYVYAPQNVQDIAIAITEESPPFNWSVTVSDESGKQVAQIEPRNVYNYDIVRNATPDSVYKLAVQGQRPGGHLHIGGLPMLLCPDAQTARDFRGGILGFFRDKPLFHQYQVQLVDWAERLKPEDLAVTVQVDNPQLPAYGKGRMSVQLGDVEKIIDCQSIDPTSPDFGSFVDVAERTGVETNHWFQPVDILAGVAGFEHPENPYFGHPALIKRLLLTRTVESLTSQAPYFWFGLGHEGPKTVPDEPENVFQVVLRSNWYPMHDGMHVNTLKPILVPVRYALPPDLFRTWEKSFHNWAHCRTLMHQGECSNQWAAGISGLKDAWLATKDYEVRRVVERQIERFCAPGVLGRVSPDLTPYSFKSAVGGPGGAADSGRIGAGVAADGLGHDAEYCLESTMHMNAVWQVFPNRETEEWLNEYYVLKTHMTLPKSGEFPTGTFTQTCCPTDFNFRTRHYTHKTPLCDELRAKIKYGDLWAGHPNPDYTWPCLEEKPFFRNLDNRYFFCKTPTYYAIVYGGPANADYANWGRSLKDRKSFKVTGYGGMHYGGFQRKASKLGGISAVWVPDCGPTWLCQNHNVNYSNGVWGRTTEPVAENCEEHHVDPYIVCEGFDHPEVEVDEENRVFNKRTQLFYAPLAMNRTIKLLDDAIDVTLEIEALGDVEFQELYESIPYYADERTITLYGQDLEEVVPFEMPRKIDASGRKHQAEPFMTGEDPDLPTLTFRAVDVAGKSGAGATVVFDEEGEFRQTLPLKYRDVAAHTGAFNLVLPTTWQKGDKKVIHYRIVPHQ